ncbi:unnamed protein product [Trichogramma brassicae]|uniref:Uncharacterized protein n=1 Tax=Trichogramma brassicae TaxID=86971 RepID=A0A6H5IAT3_9HYME|nr:unnamed protein product [Trichogramma brassicae]
MRARSCSLFRERCANSTSLCLPAPRVVRDDVQRTGASWARGTRYTLYAARTRSVAMAACSAVPNVATTNNVNDCANRNNKQQLMDLNGKSNNGGAPSPSQAKAWQQRLLGKQLCRCAKPGLKSPTLELVVNQCEVLGLYFSFVDPAASCDDFTRHLAQLYEALNNGGAGNNKKKLEVVHVLLWSGAAAQEVLDVEASFREHVSDLPWLAVACDDYERKRSSRVYYEKKHRLQPSIAPRMADINDFSKFEGWKSLRAKTNWQIEQERYDLLEKLYPSIEDCRNLPLSNLREIFSPAEIECLLADSLNHWAGGDPAEEEKAERFIGFVAKTGYKHEPEIDEAGEPQLNRTTPLHRVARRQQCPNDRRIVLELSKIYDSNYVDDAGFSHFHVACMHGCQDLVEKFLKLGQDPNCVDPVTGDSPLHLAVASNDNEQLIEALLKNGAEANSTNERTGATPLHAICARAYGDAQLFFDVADRLGLSVLINARNKSGDTPLHLALKLRNRVVCSLLRRGADPSLADADGSTALHIICGEGRGHHRDVEAIFSLYEMIFRRRLDLDARDKLGDSPLHLALRRNDVEGDRVAHVLLLRGANPNLADETGLTPLHLALERKDKDLCVAMLRKGGDPNLEDEEGETALRVICSSRSRDGELAEVLLGDRRQLVRNIDARDSRGRTLLRLVAANFMPLTLATILDHGADLSDFVFPTESCFGEGVAVPGQFMESRPMKKLRLAAGAMLVVESLESRGYELYLDDALTIMRFFAEHQMLEDPSNGRKPWRDAEDFAIKARRVLVWKNGHENGTFGDLIPLTARELATKLALVRSDGDFLRPENMFVPTACHVHENAYILELCERVSRKFFREWALEAFMGLIHHRLPTHCCEMIFEGLTNRDLYNICLASPSQSSDEQASCTIRVGSCAFSLSPLYARHGESAARGGTRRADPRAAGQRHGPGDHAGRRRARLGRPTGGGLPLAAGPSQTGPRGRPSAAVRRTRQQRADTARGATALLQGRLLQCPLG